MPINAAWHEANPMPKNATLDQRVAWHIAHAKACGCREIPPSVMAEIERRGLEVPTRTDHRSG
ncbi:MAG: hypothetical protein KIS96_01830 [Bauldia sp.]|nr:hypothetical protein [Bauldia sp.]